MPDKGAPRPSVPLDEQAKTLNKGPVLGAPEGRDQQLSASELAILAQIIKSCVQSKWNVLGGGESAQNTQSSCACASIPTVAWRASRRS
jgi:hypothetical protein